MFLEEAKDVIRYYVGNAFNVAIWGFIIIGGVYLVLNILNKYLG